MYDNLQNIFFAQFSISGQKLPEIFILQNKDTVFTDKILANECKLFFYFSEKHCNYCVEQELGNIKKFSKSIGNNNIILLASFKSEKNLKLVKELNNIHFKSYNIDLEKYPSNIIDLKNPMYFISDTSKIIRYFFLPIKENPNLSKMYYEKLVKDLF